MDTKILLVMAPQRRSGLLQLLDGRGLQLSLASEIREAQKKLHGPASYDLF